MRRHLLPAFFVLAVLIAVSVPARADETVWSGLVVATIAPRPPQPPFEMRHIAATLSRTFGYNQFTLIGQSVKSLKSGEENWLARSKHFSLRVDARGVRRNGYRLNLQLFQDQAILLETDATLSKRSPLVIRGPQIGAGQLLLLLIVQ